MSDKRDSQKTTSEPKRLFRLPSKGMIAGVSAGLADYFKVDVTLIRALLIVSVFLTNGVMIIAYFIAVLIVPTPEEDSINRNDVGRKIDTLAKDLGSSVNSSQTRNWIGMGLILFGVWLLLRSVFPGLISVDMSIVVPVLLIIVGLLFIVRGRK